MKIKEYMEVIKNIIRSKGIVILRCPYCGSLNIEYKKETLNVENNTDNDYQEILYKIECRDCSSLALINENWFGESSMEYKGCHRDEFINSIVLSDKIAYDLKYIMDIDIGEKNICSILHEMRDKWSDLDSLDKKKIGQSMVGKYNLPKFYAIMDSK